MKYTNLGKTGLKVSRLCLGTMNFGPTCDEKESYKIMDAALDLGINFFDTANMYGWRPDTGFNQRGLTEEIVGRWFKQGGNRREKVVLGTKVFAPMDDPNDGPNDTSSLSAYKIRRHLDASLRRLQTDHVELYMMHGYDPDCGWQEIWEAFDVAKYQGKVDYFGCSNFNPHNVVEAQAAADKRNSLGLVCEQHRFNLINREAAVDFFPLLKAMGIGVVTHSPMSGGLLAGIVSEDMDKTQRAVKWLGNISDARIKQLSDFAALCSDLGESCVTVAHAWILQTTGVTATLIGPQSVDQLEDTVRALDVTLPEDVLKRLNEIFPVGGSANL